MVQQYIQISPTRHKGSAGYWIVDKSGSIKEGEITEGTVFQNVLPGAFKIDPKNLKNFNVYFLQVRLQYVGLFKQRISEAQVHVAGPLKRDSKAETKLISRFRESLLDQLKPAVIDQSGGIDEILQSLQWEEPSPTQL